MHLAVSACHRGAAKCGVARGQRRFTRQLSTAHFANRLRILWKDILLPFEPFEQRCYPFFPLFYFGLCAWVYANRFTFLNEVPIICQRNCFGIKEPITVQCTISFRCGLFFVSPWSPDCLMCALLFIARIVSHFEV